VAGGQLSVSRGKGLRTTATDSQPVFYYLTEKDILQAWEIFQRFSDKGWSFTDCTSKAVLDKLNLTHAFAFDRHFQQFGTVIIIPEPSG
jgi:predicted nucleic acid-binding protein